MQQAVDFKAESDALDAALDALSPADWTRPTQFKGWSPDDILVHLHFWNVAQDLALTDPDGFRDRLAPVVEAGRQGGGRAAENAEVAERGPALRAVWAAQVAAMADRWAAVDPRARVPWVGPEMSARSAMTARQMETWAHGQAIFDMLGRDRAEDDRIANIVHLGVAAFGWSFRVQGLEAPDRAPTLDLVLPSGAAWRHDGAAPDRIAGPAVDFARVVTQTRNIADTALVVDGPVARLWMDRAQCFAGPRETPPAPGTRFRASV